MFKTSRCHPKLRIIFIQVQQTPGFGGAQCLGRPSPTACNKKHETSDIVSHITCLPRLSKTLLLQKYVPFIKIPRKNGPLTLSFFFFNAQKVTRLAICEVVGRKGRSGPYFKRQEFFSCKGSWWPRRQDPRLPPRRRLCCLANLGNCDILLYILRLSRRYVQMYIQYILYQQVLKWSTQTNNRYTNASKPINTRINKNGSEYTVSTRIHEKHIHIDV